MTLEDFEKDLAAQKKSRSKHRHRDRGKHDDSTRRERHRDHGSPRDEETRHRHKRRRQSDDDSEKKESHHHRKHHHEREDTLKVERQSMAPVSPSHRPARDTWMQAPSALDIDYVQRRKKTPSPPKDHSLEASYELKLHKNELNHHLKDLHKASPEGDGLDQPVKHEISYIIGDAGSGWRMTRLKSVYKKAKSLDRTVEDVALEQYDSLREFDDAREEEIELDRRQTHGADYVGKEKPNGDLFQERKLAAGIRRSSVQPEEKLSAPRSQQDFNAPPESSTVPSIPLSQTAINKMKAQLLKAQLRKDPRVTQLEEEYQKASAALSKPTQDTIILNAMDNRMLSTAPRTEAKLVQSRRGQARGNLEENDSMTIEDMVREERRTKDLAGGESRRFAERIAKDNKFTDDLDYLDENASKLAVRVHKSELNLRNTAIADVQKFNRALDTCPLCHHEDTSTPPVAPIIALGLRTFLTLPTQPEVCPGSATIVPIAHRTNLLECDDDEWEEIRNFMKALTRFYHAQDAGVLFYENAADPARRRHAAMEAVVLSKDVVGTAPGFFREAILASEEEWSQHRKIIDTSKRAREGLGRRAFRSSLVKEMAYFHVWFDLDGGVGHVVEDPGAWPRGDRFAREVLGGMVDADPTVVRKQGKWTRGVDERIEGYKKKWRPYDWTRILIEGG